MGLLHPLEKLHSLLIFKVSNLGFSFLSLSRTKLGFHPYHISRTRSMAPHHAGNEAMAAADVASLIEERSIPCRDLIRGNFVPLTILADFRGLPLSWWTLLSSSCSDELSEFIWFREMNYLWMNRRGSPEEFDSLCELKEVNSLRRARESGSLCEA